jgi:hypothetical protein
MFRGARPRERMRTCGQENGDGGPTCLTRPLLRDA